jgi:cytochrome oxidase Cu insertion factor (SCO1/SenC/PrrC family)
MIIFWALASGPLFAEVRPVTLSLLETLPQHWRDDQRHDFDFAEFRGRRVVLTMAYTSCRRVCPTTMAHLQRLQRELDRSGRTAEFVVIGYDPDTDDPQAWHQYRRSRGFLRSNWHFLTGTPTSTAQLARRLGFEYWMYDQHVMHDLRFIIVDENGSLVFQGGSEPPDSLATILKDGNFAHRNPTRREP